ncbi:MAG: extracellular solute-binding protein, partial [Planctomycetes bacterium]|nr:extracellular solute-binding protein [Planctomycetota bacterium]
RGSPILFPDTDWTMADFRRTAELLTCDFDGDGTLDQFGFWLPRWVYYLPFIWSFGAELTDGALTEWRFTGPAAEAALTFYQDLAVGNRVCPRDDEVPQLFQDVGFLTGKVAMCINGPWFQPLLAEISLADSYFVAPIPIGAGGRATRMTWDGVVMAPNLPPERQALAEQFVRFMLSKAVQDRIAATGKALPALRASLPAFIDPRGNIRRQVFVDALTYSRTQPLLPDFGQVDHAINDHLRNLLTSPDHADASRAIGLRQRAAGFSPRGVQTPESSSDAEESPDVRRVLEELAADPAVLQAFPGQRGNQP